MARTKAACICSAQMCEHTGNILGAAGAPTAHKVDDATPAPANVWHLEAHKYGNLWKPNPQLHPFCPHACACVRGMQEV